MTILTTIARIAFGSLELVPWLMWGAALFSILMWGGATAWALLSLYLLACGIFWAWCFAFSPDFGPDRERLARGEIPPREVLRGIPAALALFAMLPLLALLYRLPGHGRRRP